MIHWPSLSVLTPVARMNIERFRQTSAAHELDEDPRAWSLVGWSWTAEPIVHFSVRCETDERLYALEEDGLWDVVSTDLPGPARPLASDTSTDIATASGKVARWLQAALRPGESLPRGVG